jgi:hypothetical protein
MFGEHLALVLCFGIRAYVHFDIVLDIHDIYFTQIEGLLVERTP